MINVHVCTDCVVVRYRDRRGEPRVRLSYCDRHRSLFGAWDDLAWPEVRDPRPQVAAAA